MSEPLLKDVMREQFATGGKDAVLPTINFWIEIIDQLDHDGAARRILGEIFMDALPDGMVRTFGHRPKAKPSPDNYDKKTS